MRRRIFFHLAVALASVVGAALLVPFARVLPNFLLSDDGYFYAQIAYQLGTTGRSTFDGLHTTSGYHLPWALLLASLSRVIGLFTADKSVHLFGYLAASLLLIFETALTRFRTPACRVAAVVFFVAGFSLTEMVLAVPIMLAILDRAGTRADFGQRLGDRLLIAALPLVRIDLVVVPLAIAALIAARSRRPAGSIVVAALAGALVQIVLMKLAFGHFVSVAAVLKLQTPTMASALAIGLSNAFGSIGNASRVLTIAVLGALPWLRRPPRPGAAVVVVGALAFLVLHFFVSVLRDWYWLPPLLGVLLAVDRIAVGWRRAAAVVGALAALQLARMVRVEVVYAADQSQSAELVRELRARVPRGARIYQVDGSGFVGFFSERSVIDGDGLVNDYAYARRLRDGDLAGYLEEQGVCYVVTDTPHGDHVVDLAGLVLTRADVDLLFAVERRAFTWGQFALYRLRAPRCSE